VRARLQKLLAAAGVASRRHAEELLKSGRVRVNGQIAKLGDSADPDADEILLDDSVLGAAPLAYWIAHKPAGVLTTTSDPRGRPTVVGLLPRDAPRLFPVGRLDFDTEGLVLLTNDGATAQALLHPSFGNEREYRVTARGAMSKVALQRLARGVVLDDGPTAPARVAHVRFDRQYGETTLHLTLREGRKRQIRRALAALGYPVRRLVRVRLGPLELGPLASGATRPLTSAERRAVLAHAGELRAHADGARAQHQGAQRARRSDAQAARTRGESDGAARRKPRRSSRPY
jgi:pseudouridine synthase